MTDLPEGYDQFSSIQKIEWEFPALRGGAGYHDTSEESIVYNCLSWALGINWTRYDPEPKCAGYYWFPGIPRKWDQATLVLLFERHGYTITDNADLEHGFEKVVFYSDEHNVPQHFARQLPDGRWASKIGDLNDIEHETLECLISPIYGTPKLTLKRRKQQ